MAVCHDVGSDEHLSENRNRNIEISTAPIKAKLREPAYSQVLN